MPGRSLNLYPENAFTCDHLLFIAQQFITQIRFGSTANPGSLIHIATIEKSGSSKNSLTRNLAHPVICFPSCGV